MLGDLEIPSRDGGRTGSLGSQPAISDSRLSWCCSTLVSQRLGGQETLTQTAQLVRDMAGCEPESL